MLNTHSPHYVNVPTLLDPPELVPGAVDPLAYAKELFLTPGYETAKVFASCHYVWPGFAAWHRQEEAPKEMRHRPLSVARTSDARQGEFAFTGEFAA